MDIKQRYIQALNVEDAYCFAKKMEAFKTNPKLGYRTAGSEAELKTGQFIFEQMKEIGFRDVVKDEITVDSWTFEKADLYYTDEEKRKYHFVLGAYQTDFMTDGAEAFELVHAGRGTAGDYENLDVEGKVVLVDINQRDEWWINFPVYQAKLRGAKALIAVQDGGYAEIDASALNAQDIAGPSDAPAFSISRKDASVLEKALREKKSLNILMDVKSTVERNKTTYNIVGKIPGKNKERMILLSAHYDSYFDGFQDDNTAVALILNIGKTLLKCGYEPENTIVICAMAAEEWGAVDSKYDWSAGAYEQFFNTRPEWGGKIIADLNFELPALAHGPSAAVRSTYEYADFLKTFIKGLPKLTKAYDGQINVLTPIETWSDDFSAAISGIPSFVNDFSGGGFMETHYHSQFDNDEFYDENVYRFHHEFYGLLLMAIDRLAIAPLDFSLVFKKAAETVDTNLCGLTGADGEGLLEALKKAENTAADVNALVKRINGLPQNEDIRRAESEGQVLTLKEKERLQKEAEAKLLFAFKKAQNKFVRLTWTDDVIFPQEAAQNNIKYLAAAGDDVKNGKVKEALDEIYKIDNNQYAFAFDESVYMHFTDYVLNQPKERLRWGFGRIVHHENLYRLVKSLQKKLKENDTDFEQELLFIRSALQRQKMFYKDDIAYMKQAAWDIEAVLSEVRESLNLLV